MKARLTGSVEPPKPPAKWDRAARTLACPSCSVCNGYGLVLKVRSGKLEPCGCVLRAVFRKCLEQYLKPERDRNLHCVQYDGSRGRRNGGWSRPLEEFRADFEILARRVLDELHYAVFRVHYIQVHDWKFCCRKLRLIRGNFFHAIYRVAEDVGRAAREIEPFALYPCDEYMQWAKGEPTHKILPALESRVAIRH